MPLNTSSLTSKNITVANDDKRHLGNYTETTCCVSIIKIKNLNFIQNITVDYGEWNARLRNCQKFLIKKNILRKINFYLNFIRTFKPYLIKKKVFPTFNTVALNIFSKHLSIRQHFPIRLCNYSSTKRTMRVFAHAHYSIQKFRNNNKNNYK